VCSKAERPAVGRRRQWRWQYSAPQAPAAPALPVAPAPARGQWRWQYSAPHAAGGHESRPYDTRAAHRARKPL